MLVADLSPQHYSNFVAIERAGSALSIVGCMFIMSTFLLSKSFRKPITRLVFFASFGNLLTNIATLMARSFVSVPTSPSCQFQAFLVQMFMPADAFWALAMAFNVYLTFYRKYDAQRLRGMELLYLNLCYGIPFVVAITYVFVHSSSQGRMYGDALLWCWISSRWDSWRIFTFYAPVWVAIFITFFIYIRTGRQVYLKYKQLRSLSSQAANREPEPFIIMEPFSTKTTEIRVTSEMISNTHIQDGTIASSRKSAALRAPPTPAYSVTITSDTSSVRPASSPARTQRDHDGFEGRGSDDSKTTIPRDTYAIAESSTAGARAGPSSPGTTTTAATLTTTSTPWSRPCGPPPVPPPARRARPVTIDGLASGRPTRRRLAVFEANNAAWSYARCALLFFTALLVTWIPSTANRVYSLARPGEVCLGLQYASALVLPLQGLWNGLVYLITTRRACDGLLDRAVSRLKESVGSSRAGLHGRRGSAGDTIRGKQPVGRGEFADRLSRVSCVQRQGSGDSDSYILGFVPGDVDGRTTSTLSTNYDRLR